MKKTASELNWGSFVDDWRQIAIVALVVTGGGGVYAFVTPSWYESQLAVVPQAASKASGLAAALAADLPIDVNLGGNEISSAERVQAVFKSRTVSDAVIEKFRLRERYRERYIENARKALWTHCSTRVDKKPNVVNLTCEDKDPGMAQAITAYFGEYGNVVLRNISATSAGEERRFLETRWEQAKHDVAAASTKLREFEEKHKVIDLSEQSKAMISAMASLKGELLAKQIQLSYLSGFSSSDEATAAQLRRQVSIISSKLDSMMEDRDPASDDDEAAGKVARATPLRAGKTAGREGGSALFPSAMRVPKLKFEVEQLFREKKIQETLFLFLTQRYELARINEAHDTSAFQILDPAIRAERKSRPKRGAVLIGSFICGLLLGAGSSMGRRWRDRDGARSRAVDRGVTS